MSLPSNFLDELRQRIELSSVVGRRVRLSKKGRDFWGCCPFHNEKTPSFSVNNEKGFYHCFGCGVHGDHISFIMEQEGLSFMETVRQLAAQAGVEMPEQSPEQRLRNQHQKTLKDVIEVACQWFESRLLAPEGAAARAYLKKRGVSPQIVKDFRLGWAAVQEDGSAENRQGKTGSQRLYLHLVQSGFSTEQIREAGLLQNREDGQSVDLFRNRLIFPIRNRSGDIVAFGGRLLGEGQPKYLNSPETPLFHKRRTLYGLSQALKEGYKKEEIFVVEGYMDVLALVQAGFSTAVAPLGTAITEEQIQELWRVAPIPTLCLDGDSAGQRAAWRAAERALPLLKAGHSLQFSILPEGEDPDSLIRQGRVEFLHSLLYRTTALHELLWQKVEQDVPIQRPEQQAAFWPTLCSYLEQIEDISVQKAYIRTLSALHEEKLGFAPEPVPFKGPSSDRRAFEGPAQGGAITQEFGEGPPPWEGDPSVDSYSQGSQGSIPPKAGSPRAGSSGAGFSSEGQGGQGASYPNGTPKGIQQNSYGKPQYGKNQYGKSQYAKRPQKHTDEPSHLGHGLGLSRMGAESEASLLRKVLLLLLDNPAFLQDYGERLAQIPCKVEEVSLLRDSLVAFSFEENLFEKEEKVQTSALMQSLKDKGQESLLQLLRSSAEARVLRAFSAGTSPKKQIEVLFKAFDSLAEKEEGEEAAQAFSQEQNKENLNRLMQFIRKT